MTVQFLLRYMYTPCHVIGSRDGTQPISTVVGLLVVQFRNWSPTAAVYTHSWQCRARDSNHCSLQNIYHLGIEAYSTSPCNNIVIIFGLGSAGVRVMVVSGRK